MPTSQKRFPKLSEGRTARVFKIKVKICGVTRSEDVQAVALAGADAIGINLVAISPRCVTLEQARLLTDAARKYGLCVAVVVMDPTPSQLESIIQTVDPDAIQLHGHEVPSLVETCSRQQIVKALSWTGRDEEAALATKWLAQSAHRPLYFLVDAYAPSVGGGTGRVARWDLLKPKPAALGNVPMLLAGGLKPDNVAQAIHETNCAGVDTASGVETSPGIKSKALIEAFVSAALRAFASAKPATSAPHGEIS